ncbi:MAG TPA: OsmC family protein [Gemmatimonadaceae bacterium]|nr:OsmC family protein [Gemmatimonadaceae bacterium]
MKIILLSDDSIRLEPTPGPMTIEAPSADQSYSPFHMMASGLAYCTFSVMYAWAEHARLDASDLTVDVAWTFADDPHRVGTYALRFNWPTLPANRLGAAKRVAEMCTVHATLQHPPTISIDGVAAISDTATQHVQHVQHVQADGTEPVAAEPNT